MKPFQHVKYLFLLLWAACSPTPAEFLDKCMTSPEVLQDMDQITRDVSMVLKELQVRHWLDGGTLLGAYRFGSHLPFDDDVDFGVMKQDFDDKKEQIQDKLNRAGYKIEDNSQNGTVDGLVQIYFQRPSHAHMDFFLFEPYSGKKNHLKMWSEFWHGKASFAGYEAGFPQNIVFSAEGTLPEIKLLGVDYPVPVNIKAYLQRWFPEPNMLTHFVMSQHHLGNKFCERTVQIPDIRQDRKSLNKMLEYLEKVYPGRFKRSDSRLY